MASLQFQSHNKENVEGYLNSRIKGSRQVLGNNLTFQNRGLKSMQSINGAAIITPRKTLGDIQNSQTPHAGLQLKAYQTSKPALKPTLNIQKSSVKKKKSISNRPTNLKEKQKEKSAALSPISLNIDKKERNIYSEEIETMHKPEDSKDERCPPEDRVSIYLNKIISWRPPCLFGIPPVSEDESDEEWKNNMVNLDALADIDPYTSDVVTDFEDESCLEPLEVQIPYIDETLPTLDDSYGCGLSPNLGVLQLNDSVFN